MKKAKMISALVVGILSATLVACSGNQGAEEVQESGTALETSDSSTSQVEPKRESSPGVLEVSFRYTYMDSTASNQFAVWIEDDNGNLVKTLFATSYTADGGYEERPESLANWIEKANPEENRDRIDAASGATPRTGSKIFSWDCTDESGKVVQDGTYRFCVEGTMFWTSSVLFSGTFVVGDDSQENLEVTAEYSEDTEQNRNMLTNVSADYIAN